MTDRRPLQTVGLVLLVLSLVGFSGCLGPLEAPPAAPDQSVGGEAQPRPEVSVVPVAESEVLRIQGDQTMDRLAKRMSWPGSGTLAEPYVIAGLELEGRTLVLQDLSRIVVLQGAILQGPEEGPALIVWNVTGLSIRDSTLQAEDGPALAFLEARWCTVESSTLRSGKEAIQATASEALDVIDNDLRAGTTAIRTSADGGDHWIEGNRIHYATTGILLGDGTRSSLILDNVIQADTGVVIRDTPGVLLEDNRLEADEGIRLVAAHGATLLNTTVHATDVGLTTTDTDDWFADELRIDGGGAGIRLTGGRLAVLANLSYDGPGPALIAEGGETVVLATPRIILDEDVGDALRFNGTRSPVILDGLIERGGRGILLNGTHEASVIGTEFLGVLGHGVVAEQTEGTVVAESSFQLSYAGVRIQNGTGHQVAENFFLAPQEWSVYVEAVRDTYVGHNLVENGVNAGIFATASAGTQIEANEISGGLQGIQVWGDQDTILRGNILAGTSRGIHVAHQQAGGTLLIEANAVSGMRSPGLTLEDIDGFWMRTNALMTTQSTGLVLRDVSNGTIFDNWFDNLVNVAASGRLQDLGWFIEETPGTNIAGGTLLAGNWWNSYYGADADKDGIGDVPYMMLPYDEDISRFAAIPNYGVEDETPLVAGDPIPDLPGAAPAPPTAEERLHALLGLHPALDRYVVQRV